MSLYLERKVGSISKEIGLPVQCFFVLLYCSGWHQNNTVQGILTLMRSCGVCIICRAIMNVVVACKHALCLGESQEVTLEKPAKGNVSVRGRGSKWLFPLFLLLTRSLMAFFTHHKWRAYC